MLPKPPRDMTEAILREGCRERWPESQTLDFKRELPGLDARGRNEFLKDVCAMANADGGDLVYDIAEEGGAAREPGPIGTAPVFNAMRQTLQSLGVQISDIRTAARVVGRV